MTVTRRRSRQSDCNSSKSNIATRHCSLWAWRNFRCEQSPWDLTICKGDEGFVCRKAIQPDTMGAAFGLDRLLETIGHRESIRAPSDEPSSKPERAAYAIFKALTKAKSALEVVWCKCYHQVLLKDCDVEILPEGLAVWLLVCEPEARSHHHDVDIPNLLPSICYMTATAGRQAYWGPVVYQSLHDSECRQDWE